MTRDTSNPCYGCPNRAVGCHGQCPDYQAWAAVKAQERKDRLLMGRGEPEQKMRSDYIRQAEKQHKRKGRF